MKLGAAAAVMILSFCLVPLSGAQVVHGGPAEERCLDCHRGLPFRGRISLGDRTEATCRNCHKTYHGSADDKRSHPERVVPSMRVPQDMPLDREGKTTCVTCHTYHRGYEDGSGKKLFFLRRSEISVLCSSCHRKDELGVSR